MWRCTPHPILFFQVFWHLGCLHSHTEQAAKRLREGKI